MSRAARYWLNAAICIVLLAHAAYWFATGRARDATGIAIGFAVAEAVVGLLGAVWFSLRARGAA